MLSEILTVDNLLHSVVAVAFVWLFGSGWLMISRLANRRNRVSGFFIAAGLVTVGLYLREAAQVDWDFTLASSLHKHMEWTVGSVVGLLTAVVTAAGVNLNKWL